MMEEDIKYFKDVEMLKWIFYVKPENSPEDYVPQEDKEDRYIIYPNQKCTSGQGTKII